MNQNSIKKVLIANRSEICSRIQFTCKKLGIKTVSIFSSEDQFLPFVCQTSQNYMLSKNGIDAYNNQDEIIKIAIKTNCDAIHPGYGFLSENGDFAQKVVDADLTWIGPEPKNIKLMADKIQSRNTLEKAKIPFIPGFKVNSKNKDQAKKLALKIGYPIILKDPLGGGGKAIKRIDHPKDFDHLFDLTLSQAQQNTGSEELLLEKYIQNGRHIEIQIAGDGKNFIHLFERECSIQRRHQKIIEEAPCNFLDKNILKKMYQAAISIAKTINYKNIGTVEFLVTPKQKYYFLEMNTRLQVEHSITELTTGIDLVELQIHLAQNETLPFDQKEIIQNNHAIECRIYAEDAQNYFLPSCGKITNLKIPTNPYLRIDHNLEMNQEITPFFDPMISKISCSGKTRQDAIKNMQETLNELKIEGIKTNTKILKAILDSEEFLTGNVHTQLLNDQKFFKKIIKNTYKFNSSEEEDIALISAYLLEQTSKQTHKHKKSRQSNWRQQQWI